MKLCFATNNEHKLAELKQLVGSEIELKSLQDIGCMEEIPETGNTLQANSLQKASFVKEGFKINCFADDTGLEVDFLDGAPGVYSARYAGEPADSANNIDLLLTNMVNAPSRAARFKTVITLLVDSNEPIFFDGVVEGEISEQIKGGTGFGYDPVFIPKGFNHTFAEMSSEEKNSISHRGIAVRKLVTYLNNLNNNSF